MSENVGLLVYGYWRSYCKMLSVQSYKDVVHLCVSFYCTWFKILKWNTIHYTNNILTLNDNNKCVKRLDGSNEHAYILANIDPVKDGIHCWRIKTVHKEAEWIAYGVSPMKEFENESPDDPSMFGIAYNHCWFGDNDPSEEFIKCNGSNLMVFCFELNCEIDLLLDVDNGILRLGMVTDRSYRDKCVNMEEICKDTNKQIFKDEAILWGLPTNDKCKGWVPHCNILSDGAELRIAEIDIQIYGIKDKNIFM
eukprot:384634_1